MKRLRDHFNDEEIIHMRAALGTGVPGLLPFNSLTQLQMRREGGSFRGQMLLLSKATFIQSNLQLIRL